METIDLKRFSGIAKVTGLILFVAGTATITFYRGPRIEPLNHHRLLPHETHNIEGTKSREKWILGTFFMIMSCALWCFWIILQVCIFVVLHCSMVFMSFLHVFVDHSIVHFCTEFLLQPYPN